MNPDSGAGRQLKTYVFRAARAFVSATAVSLALTAPAAALPTWPDARYTYNAQREPLRRLLENFATGFSLTLRMSPGVEGIVDGNFNAASPTEFMDRLGGVYGFNWFVYAGSLYVSPSSAMVTRSIRTNGANLSSLQQGLQQLGVLDPRFGWAPLPAQGVVVVSGPPEYVKLVEQTMQNLPQNEDKQEVRVFVLKYASVVDRTATYRDQQVVTPGLATVLRNLIMGTPTDTAVPPATQAQLQPLLQPLRLSPPLFDAGTVYSSANPLMPPLPMANQPSPPAPSGIAGGFASQRASIAADPRLNAIIVQDSPERMPIYSALIAQLDVPSTLIQIDAMIVDVTTSMLSELGVSWGGSLGRSTFLTGTAGYDANKPFDARGNLLPGTIGVGIASKLIARLHALQTDDAANILSQPSILTSDNAGAFIDLSDTFYIQQTAERYASTTPIQVGTSLRVTPRYIGGTGSDSQVELTVDIEDGAIQRDQPVAGLPTVRRSNISTLAVVGDGQTLLIGGNNTSLDSSQIEKVPLLGDIPGLGWLFSARKRNNSNTQRLFLIRPRVVAINGKPVPDPLTQRYGTTVAMTWDATGAPELNGFGAGGVARGMDGSVIMDSRNFLPQLQRVDDAPTKVRAP